MKPSIRTEVVAASKEIEPVPWKPTAEKLKQTGC
jgi:hypothetical protein